MNEHTNDMNEKMDSEINSEALSEVSEQSAQAQDTYSQDSLRDETMSIENAHGTVAADDFQQAPKKNRTSNKKTGAWWVLGGIIFFVLAIGLGVFSGYQRGVNRRLAAQKEGLLSVAEQQLSLAYEDINNNQLDTAKQRVEYILQIYPGFPGAAEMLANILSKLGAATPAPTQMALPSITPEGPTPTPDLRGAEELYNTIKQHFSEQKWSEVLKNITVIREKNYSFKTSEIDGFYYISLRNDGINQIYNGKLEQGIWELNQAAQLGAMDNQAAGAINLANMYVTGASYWDSNWPEAIRIFGELRQSFPNLTDATGMTTTERYRVALYKQGMAFAASNDFCSALEWYKKSLAVAQDAQISAMAAQAEAECNKPAPTAAVTPTNTPVAPEPTHAVEETPVVPSPEPTTTP
ncbi:MAG: hypothetical protein VB108_06190 [Anaerolineaceae bacterium]|nr:hypothetical protein [Anaerolineaceae bacterium]